MSRFTEITVALCSFVGKLEPSPVVPFISFRNFRSCFVQAGPGSFRFPGTNYIRGTMQKPVANFSFDISRRRPPPPPHFVRTRNENLSITRASCLERQLVSIVSDNRYSRRVFYSDIVYHRLFSPPLLLLVF